MVGQRGANIPRLGPSAVRRGMPTSIADAQTVGRLAGAMVYTMGASGAPAAAVTSVLGLRCVPAPAGKRRQTAAPRVVGVLETFY